MKFSQLLKTFSKEGIVLKYIAGPFPTSPRSGIRGKLRGIGWTRPSREESKVRRKMAKASRRKNRG